MADDEHSDSGHSGRGHSEREHRDDKHRDDEHHADQHRRRWYRLTQSSAARGAATWVGDRRAVIAVWMGVALVLLGMAGFLGVLDAVRELDDLAALDEPVLTALAEGRSEVLTVVLSVITTISGVVVLPILVLAGCLAWGFARGRWWQAGLLAGAMVVSTIVSVTLKRVIARPRPPVDTMTGAGIEESYSFPSGHTIGAATFLLVAGYLLWVARPTWRSLLRWVLLVTAGVFAVALSRLYLGYHFVTDVVASMALALAVLGLVVVVDRRRAARAASVQASDASPPG